MVKEYRMSKARLTFLNNSKQPYPAWSMSLLKDAVEINPKTESLPNQFVYIDLEAVQRGMLISTKIYKKQDAPSRAQRLLKANDVLFQMVRPYQKNNYFFKLEGSLPTVSSTGYAQLRAKNNCQKFIYYTLHTEKFVRNVLDRCTGGTYPAINSSDLGEIVINIPCKEEQQKIAAFFTAFDQKISNSDKKLDCLILMKRRLLNDLITFTTRFKDEGGTCFQDPKVEKLKDLCAIFRSGNGITSANINQEDMYPVYGGNGIRGFTNTYTHDGVYVLIGRQGALCGNVRMIYGKNYVSEHAIAVQANQLNSTEWIGYLLDSMNLNSLSESSAQPGLSAKKLKELVVSVPCLGEQLKVAEFLKNIDSKINICRKRRDTLKCLKRAFMQQMFV